MSSKNQIVVPKEARTALGVKAGDKLLVEVRGKLMILMPKPKDPLKSLYGIAKGLYPDGYLKKERESWD